MNFSKAFDLVPQSSNVNEVTRAVLNSLFFFTKRFRTHQKHQKHQKPQKHQKRKRHKDAQAKAQNANKRISDFFSLRCF